MSNFAKWMLGGAVAALTLASAPASAQTGPWDVSTAIIGSANASASLAQHWSAISRSGNLCNFGAVTQLGAPYVSAAAPAIRGFQSQNSASQARVARNFGAFAFTDGQWIQTNDLIMLPGSGGECTILRLTIPAGGGGRYDISANFVPMPVGTAPGSGPGPHTIPVSDGVRAMVLHNSVLLGNVVQTRHGPNPRTFEQRRLCPGDTVDFAVQMRNDPVLDATRVIGEIRRVGSVSALECGGPTNETVGPGVDITALTVVEAAESIDMTGTPERPRSNCCGPWSGVNIVPSLMPLFPTGAVGPYTMTFDPTSIQNANLNAQMSAYLNYLHAMNPAVTQLTMTWQAANLGTGNTAATSGTMIGGPQTVTWNWTNSGVTMTGGGFWTGAPFPLTTWIGFQTTLSVNGGQAGATLLGPDCRVNWDAWRAQPQQITQGGNSGNAEGRIVFESMNARGQVQRTQPIAVRANVPIETGQLLIRR